MPVRKDMCGVYQVFFIDVCLLLIQGILKVQPKACRILVFDRSVDGSGNTRMLIRQVCAKSRHLTSKSTHAMPL
jgi:hypothetical protein